MALTLKSPARVIAAAVLLGLGLQSSVALADAATSANLQRGVAATQAAAVAHILQYSTGVVVTMTDGSFEQVRNGLYQRVDAEGQLIEIRAATPADTSRLLAM
ncbi:MAG: hypothetical protein Q8Q26_11985 [Pseudorhodobacter sp.]|nr:hypothetical protein [Pseudorhodobacter sp.]